MHQRKFDYGTLLNLKIGSYQSVCLIETRKIVQTKYRKDVACLAKRCPKKDVYIYVRTLAVHADGVRRCMGSLTPHARATKVPHVRHMVGPC